jgi:lysophospholipase L1-like esterase
MNTIMKNKKLAHSLILFIFITTFFTIKMNGQENGKKINLDIVYIGNSITQGVQLPIPKEDAPPATATEYLRHQPGIISVEFSNQGRSGYTTIDFLPETVKAFPKVVDAAHLLHNDSQRILIFSISLGTNDSAEDGPNGSPVDPKKYHSNLKTIADKLLAEFPGCRIVFQQPIWYSPTTYNHSRYLAGGLARLQSYFPELQELVKEYSQSNPGKIFMGDVKGFEYYKNNYLTDLIPESGNAGTFYLHPNKKGAAELGKFWGEGIYQCVIRN